MTPCRTRHIYARQKYTNADVKAVDDETLIGSWTLGALPPARRTDNLQGRGSIALALCARTNPDNSQFLRAPCPPFSAKAKGHVGMPPELR